LVSSCDSCVRCRASCAHHGGVLQQQFGGNIQRMGTQLADEGACPHQSSGAPEPNTCCSAALYVCAEEQFSAPRGLRMKVGVNSFVRPLPLSSGIHPLSSGIPPFVECFIPWSNAILPWTRCQRALASGWAGGGLIISAASFFETVDERHTARFFVADEILMPVLWSTRTTWHPRKSWPQAGS